MAQHPRYDPRAFDPVAVTVDLVVQTIRDAGLYVLLVKRGEPPFLGSWALPGGFVRPDEDLEEAAARELEEETGLSAVALHLEQLGTYGSPDRDPRMRVVTVAYWAICPSLPTPRGGGDARAAEMVLVSRIESGAIELAFDHDRILRDALERTRAKLEYTALGAQFCPPEFTISELRRVYETVWGTRLDPGNFQRSLRDSGAFRQSAQRRRPAAETGGRPASLWRLDLAEPDAPLDVPIARRELAAGANGAMGNRPSRRRRRRRA